MNLYLIKWKGEKTNEHIFFAESKKKAEMFTWTLRERIKLAKKTRVQGNANQLLQSYDLLRDNYEIEDYPKKKKH